MDSSGLVHSNRPGPSAPDVGTNAQATRSVTWSCNECVCVLPQTKWSHGVTWPQTKMSATIIECNQSVPLTKKTYHDMAVCRTADPATILLRSSPWLSPSHYVHIGFGNVYTEEKERELERDRKREGARKRKWKRNRGRKRRRRKETVDWNRF